MIIIKYLIKYKKNPYTDPITINNTQPITKDDLIRYQTTTTLIDGNTPSSTDMPIDRAVDMYLNHQNGIMINVRDSNVVGL